MLRNSYKRVLLRPLRAPGITAALARVTGTCAAILTLHRFSDPEHGIRGHDPALVRAVLAYLRKRRYDLISLQELFRRLREGEPFHRAVAFTIDDGYFDHGHVGGPLFAEFDCPVTTFVTTGFVDGKLWLWWDQLSYILERTKRTWIEVSIGGEPVRYTLDSAAARGHANRDMNARCEAARHADRLAAIAGLSIAAGVELPATPPPAYAPLSWDDARHFEKRGMTFGPHTVTHPVLSSTSDEHSQAEIITSWERLSAEARHPVPVFCYPAGGERHFGEREIATIRRIGLWGAVKGQMGELRPREYGRAPGIFRVPRLAFPDNFDDFLQCISGLEFLKARLRGTAS